MAHEGLSTQATIAPLCPRTRALAQPASQPGMPTLTSTLVIPVCGPKGPPLGGLASAGPSFLQSQPIAWGEEGQPSGSLLVRQSPVTNDLCLSPRSSKQ